MTEYGHQFAVKLHRLVVRLHQFAVRPQHLRRVWKQQTQVTPQIERNTALLTVYYVLTTSVNA
ncbi:hypothetical protein BDF19DRAFT_454552 [Syncephalis fuscata]|nr:hypothetical protein BDF19DRAFT_454552 [Syncephalis fuscata]